MPDPVGSRTPRPEAKTTRNPPAVPPEKQEKQRVSRGRSLGLVNQKR